MRREELLARLGDALDDELLVCYLGYPVRELYHHADRPQNFYMLASMGQATSIALGVAMTTDRPVLGLEGDGSFLMNLGSVASLAAYGPGNLGIVLVDNGTYAATGDQPTLARAVDLAGIVEAAGLEVRELVALDDLEDRMAWLLGRGCRVLVARVAPGNADLPFIDLDPVEIKERFVAEVASDQDLVERSGRA